MQELEMHSKTGKNTLLPLNRDPCICWMLPFLKPARETESFPFTDCCKLCYLPAAATILIWLKHLLGDKAIILQDIVNKNFIRGFHTLNGSGQLTTIKEIAIKSIKKPKNERQSCIRSLNKISDKPLLLTFSRTALSSNFSTWQKKQCWEGAGAGSCPLETAPPKWRASMWTHRI